MLNTRLICHLPLIVPDSCHFCLGNHKRAVGPGRILIFGDSIEHEAWNTSGETRVMLLLEVRRPDLADTERQALTALYKAIGAFGHTCEDQAGA